MESDQNFDVAENIADAPPAPPSPAPADAPDTLDTNTPTYETTLLTVESLKGQLIDSGTLNSFYNAITI